MHWELAEKRNWLTVDGLTFSFPSAEPDGEDKDDLPEIAPPDPTVAAINALVQEIDVITRKFEKAFPWVIGGLAVALLTVILR
jgi:hypothetical protein